MFGFCGSEIAYIPIMYDIFMKYLCEYYSSYELIVTKPMHSFLSKLQHGKATLNDYLPQHRFPDIF